MLCTFSMIGNQQLFGIVTHAKKFNGILVRAVCRAVNNIHFNLVDVVFHQEACMFWVVVMLKAFLSKIFTYIFYSSFFDFDKISSLRFHYHIWLWAWCSLGYKPVPVSSRYKLNIYDQSSGLVSLDHFFSGPLKILYFIPLLGLFFIVSLN